jgi:radical SAM-linked protein
MPKYLLTFEKNEPVRWLGHLDILRTFERAIRRAGLPVAFTSGFNPRERLAFASALATGITGSNELAVIELTDSVLPDRIVADLNGALPPGVRICDCREIPDAGSRDLMNAYTIAVYEVVCDCPLEDAEQAVQGAICSLLNRDLVEITREREGRKRTTNVRPLLHALSLVEVDLPEGRLQLAMTVSVGEGGTLRPSEVVDLLNGEVRALKFRRAHRVRMVDAAELAKPESVAV